MQHRFGCRHLSETFKTPAARRRMMSDMIDLDAARTFLATHARLLERRTLDVVLDGAAPEPLLTTLAGYRNPDGGFGWALEPDLRAPGSQPVGALEAFQVLEHCAPATSPFGAELCGWLDAVALPGGALPFALAGAAAPGTAPWWAGADPTVPSLHITSAVCGAAHHVARTDPAVAVHPWLARSTDWCLREIAARERPEGSYELLYVLRLLDALADGSAEARAQLERLAAFVPASGRLPVEGGVEGETLKLLDLSPLPGGPLRALLDRQAVQRALDELEAEQRPDGGWEVEFRSSSPAGALEWRGIATVRALVLLRANGRLADGAGAGDARGSAADAAG
jgi:hypothetical protein